MAVTSIFSLASLSLSNSLFVLPVVLLVIFLVYLAKRPKEPDAPTLKISSKPGWLGAAADSTLFMTDVMRLVNAGWERYSKKNINYLMNTPGGKLFIMAPKYFEEIRKAPDDYVSVIVANAVQLQMRYTLHKDLVTSQYHVQLPIRRSLTQSLEPKLPDIVEEAKLSLDDLTGSPEGPTTVLSNQLAFHVITRTANRLLFGKELARNPEFEQFSAGYAVILFTGANILSIFPEFLKPVVMWWTTKIYSTMATAKRLLVPVLKERIAQEDMYISEGRLVEWQKVKADDAIQWVLDETPPQLRDPHKLFYRMLHIIAVSIHTTSVTFLDTLLCLAALPEYHDELRNEIVQVFRKERGWTKQALTHLLKMDSFMSEVQRLCVMTPFKMGRVIIKDWTLSDGTVVPKGTFILTNHSALVLDPDYFPDPHKFDPWRMYRLRQQPGHAAQHQFVQTSETNLQFGHGKHACPGRFFAANEIKTLLVLVLMRYDFQCTNANGGALTLDEAIKGVWYNRLRTPVMNATIQLSDRKQNVPKDLWETFW